MHRFALVLIALASVAVAAPVPKKKPPAYPVEVGTKWEYIHDGDEKAECVEEITESPEKDGVVTVRVDVTPPTGKKTFEKFRLKDGEVWCLVSAGTPCDPPLLLWKLGAKEGDTWAAEYKIGRVTIKDTATVGKAEEITTPAGKFTATPVTFAAQEPGETAGLVAWFADGVGLVRHTYGSDQTPHQELKSFTPPKK